MLKIETVSGSPHSFNHGLDSSQARDVDPMPPPMDSRSRSTNWKVGQVSFLQDAHLFTARGRQAHPERRLSPSHRYYWRKHHLFPAQLRNVSSDLTSWSMQRLSRRLSRTIHTLPRPTQSSESSRSTSPSRSPLPLSTPNI
jgi:hypothetical protein